MTQPFQRELIGHTAMPAYGFRIFKPIQAGDCTVSAQGSSAHYCTPKKVVPAIEYSHMEVMIIEGEVPEQFAHYFEDDTVAQMPVEDIQAMLDIMRG